VCSNNMAYLHEQKLLLKNLHTNCDPEIIVDKVVRDVDAIIALNDSFLLYSGRITSWSYELQLYDTHAKKVIMTIPKCGCICFLAWLPGLRCASVRYKYKSNKVKIWNFNVQPCVAEIAMQKYIAWRDALPRVRPKVAVSSA